VNALTRIARLFVVLALGLGAPAYGRADEAAAFRPAPCQDQQVVCAKLQQSEARFAIVVREGSQLSLKSSKRSLPWQAAVLLASAYRSTAQDSIALSAGDRIAVAAVGLSSTPVRAPPAFA